MAARNLPDRRILRSREEKHQLTLTVDLLITDQRLVDALAVPAFEFVVLAVDRRLFWRG